jgi:protein-S-isoprenylcysteine O-methyltransferase Ste14
MTADLHSDQATADPRGGRSDQAAPFRFAPTFKIDLIFSVLYAGLFIHLWGRLNHTVAVSAIAAMFGLGIALCYAGKIYIIESLSRRGGDARHYVVSSGLVTDGLYAWSRNPTYFVTLVQCLLWTAMLVALQMFAPLEPLTFVASMIAPALFYVAMDRVIDREDAALAAAHPEAFAAYAKDVGRWFGRKRGAGPARAASAHQPP